MTLVEWLYPVTASLVITVMVLIPSLKTIDTKPPTPEVVWWALPTYYETPWQAAWDKYIHAVEGYYIKQQ